MEGSRLLSLLLLAFAFLSLCNAECNTAEFRNGFFPRCFKLTNNYDVYWKVEGDKKTGNVTFGLNLRNIARPWVGLGVSINGGMKGADIAVTRYDTTQEKYILEDRFATDFALPELDSIQNLELIDAQYDSSSLSTTVIYKRALVSCDLDQDQSILEGSTQIIYAFGTGTFGYHMANRGTHVIRFHDVLAEAPLPEVHHSINITMGNYLIPAQETTYTCIGAVLPADQKYHIVRWRPIIEHHKYIHHMALFGCYTPIKQVGPYECSMAPTSSGCASVVVAWAVGQNGDDFLGEFALPIGMGTQTGVYVVLQVHYNNPAEDAGIIDNSGVSLIYSPAKPTTVDVGTVPMSSPWAGGFLKLPPQVKENVRYTICHSECTEKSIPPEGVTMINWFPHMHKLGSKIWLQHISKDGVEMPEIHRDNNYDYNRQQNFPINRRIMPGDSLIMNCVWDTTSQSTWTYGGESTQEEMCIGIFQYYPASFPRVNFTRCTDLHEYLNTTGNDPSYSTCTLNPRQLVNPYDGKNFSGGVTPVIANPAYTALPPRASTCPITPTTSPAPSPSATPSPAPDTEDSSSSSSLFVAFASVALCLLSLLL